jgi:hypothetical protein
VTATTGVNVTPTSAMRPARGSKERERGALSARSDPSCAGRRTDAFATTTKENP